MPASLTAEWCVAVHSPDAEIRSCDDRQGLSNLLIELNRQAVGQLNLLLHRTEPRLMDHPDLLTEIRRLALGHHRNRIRLCLFEPATLSSHCPRLLDLLQRIPSRCEIRTPGRQHRDIGYDFVLADHRHLLYRSRPERYEAQLWLNDPAGCLARKQEFEEIWQQSELVSELRRLDL